MKVKVINKSKYDLPTYATENSAGMDLKANIENSISIKPFSRFLCPTGLFMAIPKGYEGQIRPRSGLALKYGLCIANSPGTIDSDYRGEIKVILINLSNEIFILSPGERIAQMVFTKCEQAELEPTEILDETERGEGGFGHTGV